MFDIKAFYKYILFNYKIIKGNLRAPARTQTQTQ